MPNDLLTWIFIGLSLFIVVRYFMSARARISSKDAHEKVAAGALLLDVRSEGEFRSGSIPGAKNIPVSSLGARMKELDKARPIVVFCASGMRSASAAGVLKRSGFQEVHDLGPASAW